MIQLKYFDLLFRAGKLYRWAVRLQEYDFTAVYVPVKTEDRIARKIATHDIESLYLQHIHAQTISDYGSNLNYYFDGIERELYYQHHPLPSYAREYNNKSIHSVIGNNCLRGITKGNSIKCKLIDNIWKCDITHCINGKCEMYTKTFDAKNANATSIINKCINDNDVNNNSINVGPKPYNKIVADTINNDCNCGNTNGPCRCVNNIDECKYDTVDSHPDDIMQITIGHGTTREINVTDDITDDTDVRMINAPINYETAHIGDTNC
eukprot:450135_1